MVLKNIRAEKPAYGGRCLAFVEGKALFISGILPGERADVAVTADKGDYSFGDVLEIIEESPHRITPQCNNFGTCGGCDYLHASYEAELAMKRDVITDSLTRIGKFPVDGIPPIETRSSERFGYRSHADVKTDVSGRNGFYRKESNETVSFPAGGCPLLWKPVAEAACEIETDGENGFRIAAGTDGVPRSSLEGNPIIKETEDDVILEREINCFYQANRLLRGAMRETVTRYAELSKDDAFIDGACGVGFFALGLARRAGSGIGYDIDRKSIGWARNNARKNGIENIKFETSDLGNIGSAGGEFNAIVVDPPRTGLSKNARRGIIALHPSRIVYVSCNPSTFARDAADFAATGYTFAELSFIDMFPGTMHIEMIGLFIKC